MSPLLLQLVVATGVGTHFNIVNGKVGDHKLVIQQLLQYIKFNIFFLITTNILFVFNPLMIMTHVTGV